jgi:long-subunit acyl-CoA synthetase (AMP-forming)
METYGVVPGGGAPYYMSSLLDHPDTRPSHIAMLKYSGMGGAPVPPTLSLRLEEHGVTVFRSYGSTEHPSITASAVTAPKAKRVYTDGEALDGVEIRLTAAGEILSRGPDLCLGYTDDALTARAFESIMTGYGLTEAGTITASRPGDSFADIATTVGTPCDGFELLIAADREVLARGFAVMKGYFDDPGATAEAIDADGRLHTGDLGPLDDRGHLKIIGRKKPPAPTGPRPPPSSARRTPRAPRTRPLRSSPAPGGGAARRRR